MSKDTDTVTVLKHMLNSSMVCDTPNTDEKVLLEAYDRLFETTILKIWKLSNEIERKLTIAVTAYKEIISSIAKLCIELGLKDPLAISIVFDYLLWNGYLSIDKHYCYSRHNRNNVDRSYEHHIETYYGMDIMKGSGVCLNNADMLNMVLNDQNCKSDLITVFSNGKLSIENLTGINKNIPKSELQFLKRDMILHGYSRAKYGNHICVLLDINKTYYLYDPTSICLFCLDDYMTANVLCGKGFLKLTSTSFEFTTLSNEEKTNIINAYKRYGNVLDNDKVRSIFKDNVDLCAQNLKLLEAFYDDNRFRMETVSQNLVKNKKR